MGWIMQGFIFLEVFCSDRDGNESLYHDTGICEDQHDDNCDWCCDQYYSGSDLYLCISSWSKGAALATVLSQAVGAIWILRFLSGKKTILHLRKENFKLQKEILLPCLALGISTFVMLSTESILSISFTSSLSRYGGDLAVGAMTIITSVSQLATLPLQGICQGGQPIMSYNFGAGNRDRVKKHFYTIYSLHRFYGMFLVDHASVPEGICRYFSNNTELITYTAWALRIYMAGIFSLGFQVACQQSFMALGQAKVSLLLACLRKLILLIPLIFILPHFIQNKVFAVFWLSRSAIYWRRQ